MVILVCKIRSVRILLALLSLSTTMWKRTMMNINTYNNDVLQRRVRNKKNKINPTMFLFFIFYIHILCFQMQLRYKLFYLKLFRKFIWSCFVVYRKLFRLTLDTVCIYRQIFSQRFIGLNITHLKPDYFISKLESQNILIMDISPDNVVVYRGFLPLTLISVNRSHPYKLLEDQKEK